MLVASVLPCVGSQVWLLKNPFSDPFGPVKVCSNMFGCVFVVQVHISSHQKSDIVSLHPKKIAWCLVHVYSFDVHPVHHPSLYRLPPELPQPQVRGVKLPAVMLVASSPSRVRPNGAIPAGHGRAWVLCVAEPKKKWWVPARNSMEKNHMVKLRQLVIYGGFRISISSAWRSRG